MPVELNINVEGRGGAYADWFTGREVMEAEAIAFETLDGGMVGGKPSIAVLLRLPRNRLALGQMSLRLFQTAAAATLGRYGDQTVGGTLATLRDGKAVMRMSGVVICGGCRAEVPALCNFCYECGAKLSR